MFVQAHSLVFHRVPYIASGRLASEQWRVISNFFDLVNEIEVNNKTTKALYRHIELWNGHIPKGRVSQKTRQVFFELKNFLSDKEIGEEVISEYLSARARYYRKFILKQKEDQLEFLQSVVEPEGLLLCYANGLSYKQVDYFKQNAKASFLTSCLIAISTDSKEINSITPLSDLRRFGLSRLNYQEYKKHPGAFREFIERFSEEILYYQKLSNNFSKQLPLKLKIAKAFEHSANQSLLAKIAAEPAWIFYNEPTNLTAYKLKNTIARRIYA
jgi:phytoene/squalene synthetase